MAEIQLDGITLATTASSKVVLDSGIVFPAGCIIKVVPPTVTVETNALTTSYVNYHEVSITLESNSSNVMILHQFTYNLGNNEGFGQQIYRKSSATVTTSDTSVFNSGAADSTGPTQYFNPAGTSGNEFGTGFTHAHDVITGQNAGDTLYYGFFYAKRNGTVSVPSANNTNGYFATTLFEIQK